MNEPETIQEMLGFPARGPRILAVVGLSDDPGRPSYSVSAFMQSQGYRILPVNPMISPTVSRVLGERCYASLSDLPERPDVVNVFRLPRYIPAIVDEMVSLELRNLWVQLGIHNEEAASRAKSHGIQVVMDRCILIEYQRLKRRYPTIPQSDPTIKR